MDEVYLVQDAMVLRLNQMHKAHKRQSKSGGKAGPEKHLTAEQAFQVFGGVDE